MLRGLGQLGSPSEFPEFENLTKPKTPPYVIGAAVGVGILLIVLIFVWTSGGGGGGDAPFQPPPAGAPGAPGASGPVGGPNPSSYAPPPSSPAPSASSAPAPSFGSGSAPAPSPSGAPSSAGGRATAAGQAIGSPMTRTASGGRAAAPPPPPAVRCTWHILNPETGADTKESSTDSTKIIAVALDINNGTREAITVNEADFILVTEQAAFPALQGDGSPVPDNMARIRQLDLAGGMRTAGAVTFHIPADYQGRYGLTWEPSGRRPGNFQLEIRGGR